MRVLIATDAWYPWHPRIDGVVLLEALACGVPVAALPVTGPRDLLADARTGVLDADLRRVSLAALRLPRSACRALAPRPTRERSVAPFARHASHASIRERRPRALAAAA